MFQVSGIHQKVLPLLHEKTVGSCPKQKVISKKCHHNRKDHKNIKERKVEDIEGNELKGNYPYRLKL